MLTLAAGGLGWTLEPGRSGLVVPMVLGGVALLGMLALWHALTSERRRTRALEAEAECLKAQGHKLEASLATLSTLNARLHESETRFKGLVDAQGDAILRRTPEGRLTYANDSFYQLFGLKPQEALGRSFAPEAHPDCQTARFGSGLETGKARVRYDENLRTAFGWRWIAWEDYAIRDTEGLLVEIQSVGRDITERKALEDALTEARDNAEAASRAKSGFLATMSHEIRTPMNGVLGMARLLLETHLGPEQRTYAHAIRQSGESLLALIEKILDFSKIESGTMRLDEDDVALRPLVEGVVELLSPRAHAKDIEIVAVVASNAPAVIRTDEDRLRQILINLIGNAVKFTEKGGVHVDVTIEHRGRRYLRFEVRDTGVGVPREKRGAIFQEFVQADSTHSRRFGGTGLGLAISRRLVEAMDGTIAVEAAPGGGSIFRFSIPANSLRRAEPAEATRLKGTRVAVVSRNPVLREGLGALVRMAGGEVATGWSADASDSAMPDALIVDAGAGAEPDLPAEPDPRVRSVVLIAPEARGRLAELKRMGFAGYLVKPVRPQSLAEHIRTRTEPVPAIESFSTTSEVLAGSAEWVSHAGPAHAGKALNILLAEDNPINALLTRELLRRRGHHVREALSGEAALEAFERDSFDLVITDIHMPGLDGIETAQRIRARECLVGRCRTPIVALTADTLEIGRHACEEAGMDGFLTKPVDPAELDAMLARLFAIQTEDAAA